MKIMSALYIFYDKRNIFVIFARLVQNFSIFLKLIYNIFYTMGPILMVILPPPVVLFLPLMQILRICGSGFV